MGAAPTDPASLLWRYLDAVVALLQDPLMARGCLLGAMALQTPQTHPAVAVAARTALGYWKGRGACCPPRSWAVARPPPAGGYRWTIERTGAWLGGFRRLRVRYERSSERFYALAMLACAVICFNVLRQPPW